MIGQLFFALAVAVSTPATTLAQDVADVSTRVCYGMASGALTLPGVNSPGEATASQTAIEGLGLSYGLDKTAMDGLGQAGMAIVSHSTLASRVNGSSRTILTVGQQGCRVLLVADADAAITDRVAAALVAAGWKAGPPAALPSAAAARCMFLRRDAAGKPYLLNLITLSVSSGRLRLFTTVAAIPPSVQLPQGF